MKLKFVNKHQMRVFYIAGAVVTILVSLVLGYYYEVYTDYNKETGEYKLNWGNILGWLCTTAAMIYTRQWITNIGINRAQPTTPTPTPTETSENVPVSVAGSTISASETSEANEIESGAVSVSKIESESESASASDVIQTASCITRKEWSENYTRLT
jgi:hypothetical protein